MPLSVVVGFRQSIYFASHIPRQYPSISGDRPLVGPGFSRSPSQFPPRRTQEFLRRSASVAGSGAEFSGIKFFSALGFTRFLRNYVEQFVGADRRKKRRSVAGVDQDELLDPAMLADPDSAFCEFKGVQIHHKVCYHEEEQMDQTVQSGMSSGYADGNTGKVGLPMVLLHGFGASVFSWSRVMKPLARLIGSKVLAFDRPAFGLTSRTGIFGRSSSRTEDTTPINPYSMAFSVLATLSFMDMLGSEKAILMGHSAGCLVAVNTYFEAPERIAAMILVAPAIVAPFVQLNMTKGSQKGKGQQSEGGRSTDIQWNPFNMIWGLLSRLAGVIAQAAMFIFKVMKDVVGSLYRNILSAILRSPLSIILIRMIIDKFGIVAVRNAWCDPNQVKDHVIHGYTKPLRAKGWEMALLEYTLAMLTNSGSEMKPPLARRLSEITCPVLIVTGDTDRLVPSWNSERLALAIPGSTFEVIKNCGHLPHEERVEEFLLVIKRFLQRTFGGPEETQYTSNC